MIYGYAIVSTKGQAKDGSSLENQIELLKENGAVEIYSDSFTVTKVHRSEFSKLLLELKCEDTLIITKLDKFARSINQDSELVNDLLSRGIKVNMLNIGGMDNTPTSKIIRNIFFSFAEFERDMIIERTQEGKAIAKQKEGFKEGRPKKYTVKQLENALSMLTINDSKYTYKAVEKITNISKSILIREVKKRREEKRDRRG